MKYFIFLLFFISNLSHATFVTAKSAHSLSSANENRLNKEEKQKFFISVEEQIEIDIENGYYCSIFYYDFMTAKYGNELFEKLKKLDYTVGTYGSEGTRFRVCW